MDALKFPVVGTVLLFSFAGIIAFYGPFSPPAALTEITAALSQQPTAN